jgi:hypothetical protein
MATTAVTAVVTSTQVSARMPVITGDIVDGSLVLTADSDFVNLQLGRTITGAGGERGQQRAYVRVATTGVPVDIYPATKNSGVEWIKPVPTAQTFFGKSFASGFSVRNLGGLGRTQTPLLADVDNTFVFEGNPVLPS